MDRRTISLDSDGFEFAAALLRGLLLRGGSSENGASAEREGTDQGGRGGLHG